MKKLQTILCISSLCLLSSCALTPATVQSDAQQVSFTASSLTIQTSSNVPDTVTKLKAARQYLSLAQFSVGGSVVLSTLGLDMLPSTGNWPAWKTTVQSAIQAAGPDAQSAIAGAIAGIDQALLTLPTTFNP